MLGLAYLIAKHKQPEIRKQIIQKIIEIVSLMPKRSKNRIVRYVSFGELIDQIAILEIKMNHIKEQEKLHNIKIALDSLKATYAKHIKPSTELDRLTQEMFHFNEKMWNLYEKIRKKERLQLFDQDFIDLARKLYVTSDERFNLRRAINELLGSTITEEKTKRVR